MKASVMKRLNNLEIEERPVPEVGTDRVLIKVELCGICGTDLLVSDGRFPVEIPYYNLGHEYAGTVVKTGSGVKTISVGDRVVIDPNYHCSLCHFCRRGEIEFCENRRVFKTKSNGGFAEYVSITEKLVYKIPTKMPAEKAIFAEPLSCCLHAVESIKIEPGANILIFGAGTMGLLILQLCRLKGAGTIAVSEPVETRRKMAKRLGADLVIDPLKENLSKKIGKIFPRGMDLVIESAGAKGTPELALELARKKGQVLLLAIWPKDQEVTFKPSLIVDKEVSVRGVLFGSSYLGQAINILEKGLVDVKPLLTRKYKLKNLDEAMKGAAGRDSIKIAVSPK